jgi:NitT/TauT family transport system substrate-binding protein
VRRGLLRCLSGVVLVALAAVGCGGAADDEGAGTRGGITTITLSYVPYADDAPAFLAQQKGIFRKHGLQVKFVPVANPTAGVAALTSGQHQVSFVTVPVLVNVNTRGTSLKCVGPVVGRQPSDPKRDGTTLVAARGSGVRGVADLAGKRVGVVQLNSLNTLDIQVLAQRAGINPRSVQFIQLPFPQMAAALRQNRVQAAIIVQPFAQTAIDQGATVITHPNRELWAGGTIVCFAALDSYIAEREAVIRGFNAGMREALGYAKDHEAEAKATLPQHLDLTAEQAQRQVLQADWNPTIDPATIGRIQGHMKQFGLIDRTVPAAEMVWPGAR